MNEQDFAEAIASDKKFRKHGHEFRNPERGPVQDVLTRDDLQKHVQATLVSEQTQCFAVKGGFEKGTLYFYNRDSNTLIVVPGDKALDPTVYRPDEKEQKFQEKIDKTTDQQGYAPEIKRGMYALIPELRHERQAEPMVASGEKPLRVASNVAGQVVDKLVDVVDALLAGVVGRPAPREITPAAFLDNPGARREYYAQQTAARQRDAALDRIAEQMKKGQNIERSALGALSYSDLQQIKGQGDDGLRALVRQREAELQRFYSFGSSLSRKR